MPTLPTYDSQKTPVSQANISNRPAVQQQRGAEQGFEGTKTILKGAGEVLEVWQKAQDTMDYTNNKSEYETAIAGIKIKGQDDPNSKNEDARLAELNNLKKDFVGKFHNKALGQRAAVELDKNIAIAEFEIGNIYKKKQIYEYNQNQQKLIEQLVLDKQAAPTAVLKAQKQAEIETIIKEGFAQGLSSQAQTRNYMMIEAKIDMMQNPEATIKELESDEGKYDYLSKQERLTLAQQARSELRKQKAEIKEMFENTRANLAMGVLSNTINEEDIDRMIAANKVDPMTGIPKKEGLVYKKQLYAQIAKDVGKIKGAEKYVKAANMVFSTYPDRVKAYDAIIEAYNGNPTKEEMTFLTELLQTSKDAKNAHRTSWMIDNWRLLRAAGGFPPPDIEKERDIVSAYINKIRLGEDPAVAVQSTLYEQQVKDHPALAVDPDLDVNAIYDPGKGTTYLPAKKPKAKEKKK